MNACLHLDFETRSVVDLKKSGVYVYAEHVDTDVWCAGYAFDNEPVQIWKRGEPCPERIRQHVESGGEIAAWNAAFERIIWWAVMSRRHGWPRPKLEQFRCVMVQAMAMSLPATLEMGAAALGIVNQKDMQGSRLAIQMSKPRRMDGPRPIWWDDPDRLNKLYGYCMQDVRTEREADGRLVPLKPSERELWFLDQRINDRGVQVDVALCHKARRIVQDATAKLDAEMAAVTAGEVTAVSQVQRLKQWLKTENVETDSVSKDTLTDLLAMDALSPNARRALELRREGGKASVAKIDALLKCVNKDGRARGLLQFHGANTGRWAGRRVQPQNLTRPVMENPEEAIPALMTGDHTLVEALYDQPLQVVSDCIRSMLCGGSKKVLKSADFANIEGRGTAWLAGEDWKLAAFVEADNKTGPGIYEVAAAGIFGVPHQDITKKDPRRQIGKVSELALGYQGGVGAFVTMAPTYGLRIADHFDAVMSGVPRQFAEEARETWAKDKKNLERRWGERTYLPAEAIKRAWRAKHPATVALWKDVNDAAIDAVLHPGKVVSCAAGKVKFRVAGSFLWLQLPSGRCLCYPYPRLVEKRTPWGTMAYEFRYKCVDSFTRKWMEVGTYGGSLVENIIQALARDLMAEAMLRIDDMDALILTVHDELVAEGEDDGRGVVEFERSMMVVPYWAKGFPIYAEGWVGQRYRK